MKRILICGANSFVACGFKELLVRKGFEVEEFSRGCRPERDGSRIRGAYLEIADNPCLAGEYDEVINFAVLKDQSIDDNIRYIDSLLKMCAARKVKKLIHFSSIMVYNRENKVVSELTPIESSEKTIMKGYGLMKIATDEYLTKMAPAYDVEIVRVRPGFILAPGMACPFIKRLAGPFSLILGNKKSTMPIVKREEVHKALLRIIETEDNLPVYMLYPDDGMTKFAYARKTVGGILITLPKPVFEGIPRLMAGIHVMPGALYSRFEGMFTQINYRSAETEKKLKLKFS